MDKTLTNSNHAAWDAGTTKEWSTPVSAWISAPSGCTFQVVLYDRAYPTAGRYSGGADCVGGTDLSCCKFDGMGASETGSTRLNKMTVTTTGGDCAIEYRVITNEEPYHGCTTFQGGTADYYNAGASNSYTVPLCATSFKATIESGRYGDGFKTWLQGVKKSDGTVVIFDLDEMSVGLKCQDADYKCCALTDGYISTASFFKDYKDVQVKVTCENSVQQCGLYINIKEKGCTSANSATTHWLSWGTAIGVSAIALAHQAM
jgi:hypothetical protein